MKLRAFAQALFPAVVTFLVACGGTPGPSNLFVEENAWTDAVPTGAIVISSDEFRRMVGRGELVLRSTLDVEDQGRELVERFNADRDYLAALPDPSDNVADLLRAVSEGADYLGDIGLELNSGEAVRLEGLASQLRRAVEDNELSNSVANARAAYALNYDLLPDGLKGSAPTPASLAGKSLAEVQAAMATVDALLGTLTDLDHTSIDPDFMAPGGGGDLQTQAAGNGVDADASCKAPTGFVTRLWFPLKQFISPVKAQANRGTCWAFAAVGALESRERVQNDNPVNLSEQFLINKVKNDWARSDYTEGYFATRALDVAAAVGQTIPPESLWTYNPAMKRASDDEGKAEDFAGTCDPYGTAGGGWCSETAHQSPVYCTTLIVFTFCGYQVMTSSSGVASSKTVQVWASGQTWNLNTYRNLLAQGHVLLAGLKLYEGFWSPVGGVVSNYDKKYYDAKGDYVDGNYGGHDVQIVAFLSNADLSTPSYTYDIGGGGYFVIKNSWGCGAGDGGYYYVPADYVESHFDDLYTLDFDSRRSAAWKKEQATPGSMEAPAVTITDPRPTIDLRVGTDLTSFFGVTHSVAGSVSLYVRSDKDGVLFDGAWNTSKYSFASSLVRTFTSIGQRTISVRASFAGNVDEKSFVANVVNTAPTLGVDYSGTAYISEFFPMAALVWDINEAGIAGLCSRTTWSVSSPDTVSPASGCQVAVNFGTTGSRTVTVTTRDADGLSTTRSRTLNVQPPRANPYPRITSYGVQARGLAAGNVCQNFGVASGTTIDIRENGCNLVGETGTHKRFSAFVTVENPDNEALTYDWLVYVTYNDSEHILNNSTGLPDSTYVPVSPGNSGAETNPCRIAVHITAPEASRSKYLTVWSGSCTYDTTIVN